MKLPEIDAKRFYQVGKFAFFSMALIGMIRLVDVLGTLESYEYFSSIAYIIFQFVLAAFFGGLQKQEDIKELKDEDIFKMNDALNKLNLEEKENAKKK